MDDGIDPSEGSQRFFDEFDRWIEINPNAGAGLVTGGIFPALASYKAFSDAAYRLDDAVAKFDRNVGGRTIAETALVEEPLYRTCFQETLRDVCDAIHALWNVGDVGNNTPHDLLLEYIKIEGYGLDRRTQEIPDDFRRIVEELGEIAARLRFMQDLPLLCGPFLWEWRLGRAEKGPPAGEDDSNSAGSVIAWWAPADALDDAVAALDIDKFPDSSNFWECATEEVDRHGKSYSPAKCLEILTLDINEFHNELDRQYQQAIAIEWTRRRRQTDAPRRDDFLHDDFEPVSVGVGWFESEDERWPIIDDEGDDEHRDGPASNVAAFAWSAYEHLRFDTDAGIAQVSEEELEAHEDRKRAALAAMEAEADDAPASVADPESTPTLDLPMSLPATPDDWEKRLGLNWRKQIRPMFESGKLHGERHNARLYQFALEHLKRLGWTPE